MSINEAEYDTYGDLRATAAKLRGLLDGIELGDSGDHESTIRNLARVSVALTTTCAELRQHAKQAVREVSKIPWDTLVSFLKSLPMAKREDLARDITGADDAEPLL